VIVLSRKQKHRLSIETFTPKLAVQGEEFPVSYRLVNVGSTSIIGTLIISITWPSLDKLTVTHELPIKKPLQQNDCILLEGSKISPLQGGYTMFYVAKAITSNNEPIEVCLPDGRIMYPPIGGMQQPFHSVRVLTHEEKFTAPALLITAIGIIITSILTSIQILIQIESIVPFLAIIAIYFSFVLGLMVTLGYFLWTQKQKRMQDNGNSR